MNYAVRKGTTNPSDEFNSGFRAGIDVKENDDTQFNRIECYGDTRQSAEALRDYVFAMIQGEKL